ncbi:hypothetical protein VB776_12900 [Arcicella sp. DC2W]|uniref:Aerotolerance regulator N-terminal domain-containing protein n=1 Tax=Arcicella gelida TaxID=2984195 RepID=A0ABU5S6F3_9BACT|nr:hypothetical protein [Arcicella sp. DC2W]MEA5403818.1 hypothetical protein [Arcicella sp. DC2W]
MILNLVNINTFSTFDWLIVIALLVLLCIQIFALQRNKSISQLRFWLKIVLNISLWAVVVLLFINPSIEKELDSNKVLLVSENVPQSAIQRVKDSLKITEVFSQKSFNRQVIDNRKLINQLGKIYLLGEDASPELLSKIQQHAIHWIPFFQEDELQEIHWNGITHQGEIQQINGKIYSSVSQILRLKLANQVLDSIKLTKGFNAFTLNFTNFSIGKTTINLALGDKPLKEINYFSLKNQPHNFLFILSNPDFESKTLADWLGKNGNKVETVTTVAKNTQSTFSINSSKKFIPDIIITDPSNAGNALVKKAFSDGKSVLFINIENPDVDVRNINQNLGTKWKVKRISNQENRVISQDLTAHSYQFEATSFQKNIAEYPIAIQKRFGKVGVSLLNESFPLILSGDSITYSRIWQSTFQTLYPSSNDNIKVDAPIFTDIKSNINTKQSAEELIFVEKDTVATMQSGINPLSAVAKYTFRKSGWNTFQDSLSIYVEEGNNNLAKSKIIKPYLSESGISNAANATEVFSTTMPEWFWYLLIVLLLTALWLEPKF